MVFTVYRGEGTGENKQTNHWKAVFLKRAIHLNVKKKYWIHVFKMKPGIKEKPQITMYYNTTANNNSTVHCSCFIKPSVLTQTWYFFPFCPRLSPRRHSGYSTAVLAQPTLAVISNVTQELLLQHYQRGHKLLVPEHFPAA